MSTLSEPAAQPSSPAREGLTPVAARNRELLQLRDGALHLAYRISGHRDDAEDILQEAFLRAVRAESPLLTGVALRNWFLQIVANSARDLVRSESARRNRERKLSMESPASVPPSQSLEQAELKQRVEHELSQLNEKLRVPLALHYEHGLSFEEVSSVLGIPAGTLRVQASRGLDELRARLNTSGEPVTAQLLIGVLAAGALLKPAPAVAAAVDAIVTLGAKPLAAPAAAGMKIFAAAPAAKVSLAVKLGVAAACLVLGAAAFLMYARAIAARQAAEAAEEQRALAEAMAARARLGQTGPDANAQSIDAPPGPNSGIGAPNPVIAVPGPAAPPGRARIVPRDFVPPPQLEAQWAGAVDLLSHADPARDAVVSAWRIEQQELIVEPYKYSKYAFNFYPPEEFDYRIDYTRRTGNGEVDMVFPVDGKSALLSVGAWGKLYFSGDPKGPDAVPNIPVHGLVRHTAIVEVRKATLTAWLDGKKIKTIEIAKSAYVCNPHWRVPDQQMLGVGTWDSGVAFHRVAIREVTGKGQFKDSDPDLERSNDPVHWQDAIDALKGFDPKQHFVKGNWAMEGAALRSQRNQYGRVELGYEPPEEYDFRIDFRRIDGNRDIVQICTAKGHQFSWKIAASDHCVFDSIDGKINHDNPAAVIVPDFCIDTQPHVSVVCVRKDGVKAFVDGKLMGQWRTNYSDMGIDIWKLKNINSLGVGTHDSNLIFDKILIKEIAGKGKAIERAEEQKDAAF